MSYAVTSLITLFLIVISCTGFLIDAKVTITNEEDLQRGVCHGEKFKLELSLDSNTNAIQIGFEKGNSLLDCKVHPPSYSCSPIPNVKGEFVFNKTDRVLFTMYMIFNHTNHGGKHLEITINNIETVPPVLLKTCQRQFENEAYQNMTQVTIMCLHPSFNLSTNGIHILDGKNTLGECRRNPVSSCSSGAKALPNGIQFTTEYRSDMQLRCELDGQDVGIQIQEQTTKQNKPNVSRSSLIDHSNRLSVISISILSLCALIHFIVHFFTHR
uniref:Uncharacterized protein LOC111110303 isoform X1 n=1 Tax=Crassostrea virginica TaxID=6565 RepID=A0A8B8BHL3_CRAVI|nr:uncharacterized protein LOC111110303 isoform X1 [Crassostrea virginica]